MVLNKDFNLPKMHILLAHSIEDIRRKGPLKNASTILGESGHAIFKKMFKRTNARNFEYQASFTLQFGLPEFLIHHKLSKLHGIQAEFAKIRVNVDERDDQDYSSNKETDLEPIYDTIPLIPSNTMHSALPECHILTFEQRRGTNTSLANFENELKQFLRMQTEGSGLASRMVSVVSHQLD